MALDFAAMMKQAELDMMKNMNIQESKAENLIQENILPSTSFHDHRLHKLPGASFYVPDFLSEKEAKALVGFCESEDWITLSNRRLKNFGGVPHPNGTILEPMPQILQQLSKKLKKYGVFDEEPNQALVNEYSMSGGIGYHKDGPNFKPKAAIVSLLSPCLIRFIPEDMSEESNSMDPVFLEPNSLFVFTESLYTNYKHGILCQPIEHFKSVANSEHCQTSSGSVNRGSKRYSLTLRCVSKISYNMSSLSEVLLPHLQQERVRRLEWWKKAVNESSR